MPTNEKEVKLKLTAEDKASAELAKAMDKVKTAATVAFTAVAGAVALSVNAAAEFQKGMSNVYTIVDKNEQGFGLMAENIKLMSRNVPVAIGDLTSALYDVRSAGIGAGDALNVLENSAKLGVAGLGTTKEAVNLATSAINAFSLQGRDADAMFNTMFLTVKAGKTTIAELAQSFGNVAPVAAAAGIKLEELQAATAALTVTGQKASVAQTQLRSAILAIQAPSDAMQKLLQKAGVTDVEATLKKEGLVKVMERVKNAAAGDTVALKGAYGSVEAFGASLALAGPQGELFKTILKGMQDSLKATEGPMKDLNDAFDIQKGTFSAQAQIIKNQLNVVLINLGEMIMPVLIEKFQKISAVLTDLTDAWMDVTPETKQFIVTVATAVATFVTTASTLVGIAVAVTKVKEAASALFLVMKANPFMIIVGLLISLGAVLYNLYQTNEGFRNKVNAAWESIKSVVGTVVNFFTTTLPSSLKTAWDGIVSAGHVVVDFFTKTIPATFSSAWNSIAALAKSIWDKVNSVIQAGLDFIMPIFSSAWNAIKNVVSVVLDFIKKGLSAFNEFMQPLWDSLWNFYNKVVVRILTGIWDFIKGTFNAIVETVKVIGSALSAVWSTIWDAIKSVASVVWEAIKVVVTTYFAILQTIFETARDVITAVWKVLWDAIKAVLTPVWDAIKTAVSAAFDFLKGLFEKAKEILSKVWEAIWGAIEKVVPPIWESIKGTVKGAVDTVGGIFESAKKIISIAWQSLWDGIVTTVTRVRDTIIGIVDAITKAVDDALNAGGRAQGFGAGTSNFLDTYSPAALLKKAGVGISSLARSALHFADGGNPPVGVPSMVGERGPELFIPRTSGRIIPNGQFGGGSTINNYITGNTFLDDNAAIKMADKIHGILRRQLKLT